MKPRDFWLFSLLFLLTGLFLTRAPIAILGAWAIAVLLHQILFRRNFKLLGLLLMAVLCLFAFDRLGRLIIKQKIAGEFVANVDHTPRPDARKGYNEDGVRTFEDEPVSAFRAGGKNLVFLGDSFTQGYMVRPHESFPFQAGEILKEKYPQAGLHIANFGWISSSPLLDLRRLRRIGARYHPATVVLCLDMTDFHDDLKYRKQLDDPSYFSPFTFLLYRFQLQQTWEQVRQSFRFFPSEGGIPARRYFILNQPLERSRPYLDEIEGNIRQLAGYCRRELHASFVLVMLPRGCQYDARETPSNKLEPGEYTPLGPYVLEPFRWLAEFAGKVDFPCYSLLDDFRGAKVFPTCYATDPHWTRAGHQVAGAAIAAILEKRLALGDPIPETLSPRPSPAKND